MKILNKSIIFILIISMLMAGFCFRVSALVIYENNFGFEVNTSEHEAILVSYVGDEAFVQIPDYFHGYPVAVIDRNAFSGNKMIRGIVFSDTNTTVEEYAFMNCSSLESVYIPENVTNFGDRVFANCTSLQNVTMLSDIVSMPTNMFSGCASLSNLIINDQIAEFSYGCFKGCSSLTDLGFVSNGALIQSYAFSGTGAESVDLCDELVAIPNYAFTNCSNLHYVTIPKSVVLIQPRAFDFENVTIGCYYDSYAYSFAKENGYSYELLDEFMLGDTNGDDCISITDVTLIQCWLVDLKPIDELHLLAADVDMNGVVDINDATAIQFYLAQFEVEYPIGQLI